MSYPAATNALVACSPMPPAPVRTSVADIIIGKNYELPTPCDYHALSRNIG